MLYEEYLLYNKYNKYGVNITDELYKCQVEKNRYKNIKIIKNKHYYGIIKYLEEYINLLGTRGITANKV